MVKVLGVGDNVVDRYLNLGLMFPGGNALNVAVFAGMNNARAGYLGKFGNDEPARHIQSVLSEIGIDTSHCRYFEGENGYADVNLLDGDRIFINSNKGGVAKKTPWNFNILDSEYLKSFDLIHSSLNSYIEKDLKFIRANSKLVSFDFSCRWNDDYLAQVCPSIDFAFFSASHLTIEKMENEMLKAREAGCSIVCSTRGEDGAYALVGRKRFVFVKAKVVKPIDTMGAGDAWIASFLVNYLMDPSTDDQKIKNNMIAAADFSSVICKTYGAFGYGMPFEPKIEKG